MKGLTVLFGWRNVLDVEVATWVDYSNFSFRKWVSSFTGKEDLWKSLRVGKVFLADLSPYTRQLRG